jgi:TonB family protein
MRQYDDSEQLKIRNPARPDAEAGIATPHRVAGNLFQGWGPKLMAAALAASALAFTDSQVKAATLVAMGTTCQDHAARLVSSPAYVTPDGVNGAGEAVYRVNLSAFGKIESLTLERSAGDPLLDFTAMHVIRESRYDAAIVGCKASAQSFLYSVNFDN